MGFLSNDMIGYSINIKELCLNQNFTPEQVVSSELVFPRGAVPNSMLLWVRIELTSGKRRFVTLPLVEFYRFIDLPESSIGGWTDGNRGSDYSGLNARYEVDDTGGYESVSDELQLSTESATEIVETAVPETTTDRSDVGV
jgi:hypothetical protein